MLFKSQVTKKQDLPTFQSKSKLFLDFTLLILYSAVLKS